MFYLGIFLILWAILVYLLAGFKIPAVIWNMGKVQGFVKIMGEAATRIMFAVLSSVAMYFGIWLLIQHWPAA